MSNAFQPFMERALALAAQAAELGEVPVGAVVVKDGQIIAEAHNLRERAQDPTAHAELLAIRLAAEKLGTWRLEGCTVVVTLEPCPMCAGAMVQSRVERCVFGCTDPKGGFAGTVGDLSNVPQLNHSFEVHGGLMGEEAAGLLKTFFRQLRTRRR
ncbi:MAG: nucleoside deaminase [Deltaproteobacteria bacterium]|nr:nucleoside deaminase [Deltaproteobacteria bacterium]